MAFDGVQLAQLAGTATAGDDSRGGGDVDRGIRGRCRAGASRCPQAVLYGPMALLFVGALLFQFAVAKGGAPSPPSPPPQLVGGGGALVAVAQAFRTPATEGWMARQLCAFRTHGGPGEPHAGEEDVARARVSRVLVLTFADWANYSLPCGWLPGEVVFERHPPSLGYRLTHMYRCTFHRELDYHDWFFYAEGDIEFTAAAAAEVRRGYRVLAGHTDRVIPLLARYGPRADDAACPRRLIDQSIAPPATRVLELAGERWYHPGNPYAAAYYVPRATLRALIARDAAAWTPCDGVPPHALKWYPSESAAGHPWLYAGAWEVADWGTRTAGEPVGLLTVDRFEAALVEHMSGKFARVADTFCVADEAARLRAIPPTADLDEFLAVLRWGPDGARTGGGAVVATAIAVVAAAAVVVVAGLCMARRKREREARGTYVPLAADEEGGRAAPL